MTTTTGASGAQQQPGWAPRSGDGKPVLCLCLCLSTSSPGPDEPVPGGVSPVPSLLGARWGDCPSEGGVTTLPGNVDAGLLLAGLFVT